MKNQLILNLLLSFLFVSTHLNAQYKEFGFLFSGGFGKVYQGRDHGVFTSRGIEVLPIDVNSKPAVELGLYSKWLSQNNWFLKVELTYSHFYKDQFFQDIMALENSLLTGPNTFVLAELHSTTGYFGVSIPIVVGYAFKKCYAEFGFGPTFGREKKEFNYRFGFISGMGLDFSNTSFDSNPNYTIYSFKLNLAYRLNDSTHLKFGVLQAQNKHRFDLFQRRFSLGIEYAFTKREIWQKWSLKHFGRKKWSY